MQFLKILSRFLKRSKEVPPETISGQLALIRRRLLSVNKESWEARYRPSIGSTIDLVVSHQDPEDLLKRLEIINGVISEDGYVDNAFGDVLTRTLTFDEWFTIRGEFVNFPVFIDLLDAELITLQTAFSDMEVCKVDKLNYYTKKVRLILEDLEQMTETIVTVGSRL